MSIEDELLEAFPGAVFVDVGPDAEEASYRERAAWLLDELDIGSTTVRFEMLADPERACLILEHARQAKGLKNRAGYAVKRWRSGYDPRRVRQAPDREPEPPEAAPSLSAIEYAWSLGPPLAPVARMMAASIGRTGGFVPVLEAGFNLHEQYGEEIAAT